MPAADVWFLNNDMVITLSGLRSSTMAASSYLNSSTNVSVTVWKALSTAASTNRIIAARNMGYVAASNGNYRAVGQSTEHSMSVGTRGIAIITVNHSGLNGEWRVKFPVEERRTT